jgi:hypothetical protein
MRQVESTHVLAATSPAQPAPMIITLLALVCAVEAILDIRDAIIWMRKKERSSRHDYVSLEIYTIGDLQGADSQH